MPCGNVTQNQAAVLFYLHLKTLFNIRGGTILFFY